MRKVPPEFENALENLFLRGADFLCPPLKATGHTPNMITTYSAASAALSLAALHHGRRGTFLLFWELAYFFDCVDGHFARRYNQVTTLGDLYDHGTDVAANLGLLYLVYTRCEVPAWATAAFLLLFLLASVHLGCVQRARGAKPTESLDMLRPLCPDASWVRVTRFMGPAVTHLLIGLLALHVDAHHRRRPPPPADSPARFPGAS